MDNDLVEETLTNIERIYRDGDRETAIANLEKIKARVDALHEDLI